jgi:hypothetical protein
MSGFQPGAFVTRQQVVRSTFDYRRLFRCWGDCFHGENVIALRENKKQKLSKRIVSKSDTEIRGIDTRSTALQQDLSHTCADMMTCNRIAMESDEAAKATNEPP